MIDRRCIFESVEVIESSAYRSDVILTTHFCISARTAGDKLSSSSRGIPSISSGRKAESSVSILVAFELTDTAF